MHLLTHHMLWIIRCNYTLNTTKTHTPRARSVAAVVPTVDDAGTFESCCGHHVSNGTSYEGITMVRRLTH